MITLNQLRLSRGSDILFSQADAAIHGGQRIGLVGNNGCGKSSLFALLRGEIEADSGELIMPPDWRIASVRQETPSLPQSALDYVLDGHQPYRQAQHALKQAEQEANGLAIAAAHEQLAAIHGYALPAQAGELLNGLGFLPAQQQLAVAEFSGGWRMRLNLAQALIAPADLLLLDEPTNHLDLDAIIWLQDFLKSHPATQIIIAHDREFLDSLCQHIWHISGKQLESYRGNYSQFERIRHERRLQADAQYAKQAAQRAHLQSFVDRFRAKASKAKQAQSRLKALEKLDAAPPPAQEQGFQLEFATPEHIPAQLLKLEKTALGYGETNILKAFSLAIEREDRIGLLGRNGAGKSTLMKALAGLEVIQSGERKIHQYCQIGYFTQHSLDRLEATQSPLWHMQQILPAQSEQEHRNFLGNYGFGGDRAYDAIASFSGGEKARLALALIIAMRPNLLLLDEPTNHLDLAMRDSLNLALQAYEGAMVIISHDRNMLRSTCNRFFLIDQAQVSPFDGDLDDYRRHLQQSLQAQLDATKSDKGSPAPLSRQSQKRNEAEIRRLLRPFKQILEKAEAKVTALEAQKQTIENRLADADIYLEENKDKLKQILAEQTNLQQALAQAEAAWLEAAENLQAEEMKYTPEP